jgi:hypothetical protein
MAAEYTTTACHPWRIPPCLVGIFARPFLDHFHRAWSTTLAQLAQSSFVRHPYRVVGSMSSTARDPEVVFVGRFSPYENPFAGRRIDGFEAAAEGVAWFRDWLLKGPASEFWVHDGEMNDAIQWARLVSLLPRLRGMLLADNVPLDMPSHADVLAEVANRSDVPSLSLSWAAFQG